MKDSGVQWIEQIPDDWKVDSLKKYIKVNNGKEIEKEISSDFENSIPVYGSGGVFKYTDKEMYSGKAVMFGRKGTLGKPIYFEGSFWTVDTMYYLTSKNDVDMKFNFYQLSAFDWFPHITQTALPSIVASEVVATKFPFPKSVSQQTKIADFLDKKCSEIQSAIDNTKQTIEEYKKLKQAVITKAVTKGIRKNRKLKDSGIDWLGEIPEEWEDINPKALFSLRKQKASYGERQLTASQQYGIVYQDEYMEMTGARVVTVMKDFDILKHVESGDFVISMRSFQGGIEYSEKSGSISSAYVMLIPNLKYVVPRYYRWLLKCQGYIKALNGTTDLVRDGQAMRYSNFAQVRLIKVPIDEQKEIADFLDEKCANIDKVISQKEQFITELEKYKQSLIYEYVTGKKEVK